MQRVIRNVVRIAGGFLAWLLARRSFLQPVMVFFLVTSLGLVAASDSDMKQVVQLQLRSTPTQSTTNDVSTGHQGSLSAAPPRQNTLTVLSQRRTQGKPPKQRNPELSTQHLVVVGINANGEETSRTVILDPRTVRAEVGDPSGQLTSSESLYRKDVTFPVALPDDPGTVAVRLYKPRWTGKDFALDVVGEAALPGHD